MPKYFRQQFSLVCREKAFYRSFQILKGFVCCLREINFSSWECIISCAKAGPAHFLESFPVKSGNAGDSKLWTENKIYFRFLWSFEKVFTSLSDSFSGQSRKVAEQISKSAAVLYLSEILGAQILTPRGEQKKIFCHFPKSSAGVCVFTQASFFPSQHPRFVICVKNLFPVFLTVTHLVYTFP